METISKIPQGVGDDILERTVRENNNLEFKKMPGEAFEYAMINYDVLGLIIEKVNLTINLKKITLWHRLEMYQKLKP